MIDTFEYSDWVVTKTRAVKSIQIADLFRPLRAAVLL